MGIINIEEINIFCLKQSLFLLKELELINKKNVMYSYSETEQQFNTELEFIQNQFLCCILYSENTEEQDLKEKFQKNQNHEINVSYKCQALESSIQWYIKKDIRNINLDGLNISIETIKNKTMFFYDLLIKNEQLIINQNFKDFKEKQIENKTIHQDLKKKTI